MKSLADLTTIGVGGQPAEIFTCTTREQLIETAHDIWRTGEDWLVLGGGSNIVAADEIENLHVIQVATQGVETSLGGDKVILKVQAGENWDDLVAGTVEAGLSGIEALSGIPGSVGATPIQNIGAYGQEVENSIRRVEFLDYETYELQILQRDERGVGYRDSIFKRGKLGVVTWVEFELQNLGGQSQPIFFDQLAKALGVDLGAQVAVSDVRQQVLKLRKSKGMVLDSGDLDTKSCGSFFTNPIVSDHFARTLPLDAPKFESTADDGQTVKLSAAWLIENSGIAKGFSIAGSRAAVSSKHTLAITNRGGATAFEVVQLANFIQQRVLNTFGVN
ncbi:MAG: UDP-N-acetylmuramate dehydrogenase, partial [Micrococcales bacterium]